MAGAPPRTMYDKIWDAHAVAPLGDGEWLLYVDRHLLYEVTSPQAFDGLPRRKEAKQAVLFCKKEPKNFY